MNQAIEKLPKYQKRRIQETGVSEDRIKLLYHTVDQAWHKLARVPLRKAPGVMVKLGMTRDESLLMLMIYFNLKLKLKENGSTN